MKRRAYFVLSILALFFAGSFAAFAGGHAESGSSGGSAQASAANLTGNSAQRAVEAAKAYAGQTLTIDYEAGLQAINPEAMAPKWLKATGVHLKVVPLSDAAMYTKEMTAAQSGQAETDVVMDNPQWIPDYYSGGVIIRNLAPYIAKYANPKDTAQLPPDYKPLISYNGTQVGLLTDSDDWILYYRKDWFTNPANMSAFQAEFGRPLEVPKTWVEFDDIAKFFTQQGKGKYYGLSMINTSNLAIQAWFDEYGSLGGQYFDPATMKPLINGRVGVQALNNIVYLLKFQPPGAAKYNFVEAFAEFITGKTAMTMSWAPIGKFAEGMANGVKAFSFVPTSVVVGKVGFATPPGKHDQFANGWVVSVNRNAPNKTLAYLFAQWYASPSIHQIWASLPDSLGKPTYLSEFRSQHFNNLFPQAHGWVKAIEAGTHNYHPDVLLPGGFQFNQAIENAMTAAMAGESAQKAMNQAAHEWQKVVNEVGVSQERTVYTHFLLPIEKKGIGTPEPSVP